MFEDTVRTETIEINVNFANVQIPGFLTCQLN